MQNNIMLQPSITKRQNNILDLLLKFRFLDPPHLQQFFHHTDKRDINKLLKDLTDKQYIHRIYDKTIIGKNRVSAVYYLATNGIRFLKTEGIAKNEVLQKLYYEKNRSEGFISHSLFIAAVCCQLEQKNTANLKYTYTTESDLSNPENPYYFLKEYGFSIDLCFSKKQTEKDTQYYLLKLFDETLPKYRIQKQIRDLKDFYFNNEWENNIYAPFPTILLIGETKELMIYIKRYTKSIFEDEIENLNIHFATAEDVRRESITGQVWEPV